MRYWKRGLAAVVVCTLAGTACSPDAASPTVPGRPAAVVAGLATLFNVQIRAVPPTPTVPPNPVYGWGHLQLWLAATDLCVPPNPVVPAGLTLVSVCGKIFNDGGVRYVAGGLYELQSGGQDIGVPALVASFEALQPTGPCRRYELAGSMLIADALADESQLSPSRYVVLFDGLTAGDQPTQIGGRLDGTAWGPIGERLDTDPFYAQKVCDISIH